MSQIPRDNGRDKNQDDNGDVPRFSAGRCAVLFERSRKAGTEPRPCLARTGQDRHDSCVHGALIKELPPRV